MDKKLLETIRVIRNSFHEAATVYTNGGCYEFYKIIKSIRPKAIAYLCGGDDNYDEGCHIITKIGKRYYDINGLFLGVVGKKFTEELHYEWDANISGLSASTIIKRWNKRVEKSIRDIK